MSKILKELADAVEIDRKRNETDEQLFQRIMVPVSELGDAEWNGLSDEAQEYFNAAADAANKKLPFVAPPDSEEKKAEAPANTRARTRTTAAAEPEKLEPRVGLIAKVVTKRGKEIQGLIVELDAEVIVIKPSAGGDDEELNRSRVESITVIPAAAAASEPEPPADPKVGDTVKVVTARGKEITGALVEEDGDVVVIKTADGDEELNRSRIKSIEIVSAKKTGGRAAKSEEKPEPAKSDEKPAGGRVTKAANGGVSVTMRIRQLIAEDLDISAEGVGKALKKEGLEFRDNTLKLTFDETNKVISVLKEAGRLK